MIIPKYNWYNLLESFDFGVEVDMNENVLDDYIALLASKGFRLSDGDLHFVDFGRHYTDASEPQVKIALEVTLIKQLSFDGSYFIAVLESLVNENITSKQKAYELLDRLQTNNERKHSCTVG
ncbi:hypothetical protein IHV12_12375 [Fictibacillus sp. 7GRE50]|uniref:DUF6123 family protein n=2 Tax=Fictibacillaceae TaxID=3120697 RepID=UPI0018CDE3CF|nr:DUF6123 family protein [Fictibacillus sp. 7GRE50]MBH0165709.1 hypothetical protein [Fictibacillus sp. 7GRE50]